MKKNINFFLLNQEKYHIMKNRIIINKNNSILNLTCFYCGKKEHLVKNCPKLHYIPNLDEIKKNYLALENKEYLTF